MSRNPYVTKLIHVLGDTLVRIEGIGRPKEIRLPAEVVKWLDNSRAARRILEELIGHYKFRIRLSHPGAIRSLILLLYSRAQKIAPYKVARSYGIAPEQLYRLERGLKKDGLYDFVLNLLHLERDQHNPNKPEYDTPYNSGSRGGAGVAQLGRAPGC